MSRARAHYLGARFQWLEHPPDAYPTLPVINTPTQLHLSKRLKRDLKALALVTFRTCRICNLNISHSNCLTIQVFDIRDMVIFSKYKILLPLIFDSWITSTGTEKSSTTVGEHCYKHRCNLQAGYRINDDWAVSLNYHFARFVRHTLDPIWNALRMCVHVAFFDILVEY